jgi:hypothetical protein
MVQVHHARSVTAKNEIICHREEGASATDVAISFNTRHREAPDPDMVGRRRGNLIYQFIR